MPILGTSASQNTKSFLGLDVDYLVVAGGGSGGGGYNNAGGGGGAGGYRTGSALTLDFNTNYTVTVGAGGTNGTGGSGGGNGTRGTNGSNSVFGSITSSGGGVGASRYSNGAENPVGGVTELNITISPIAKPCPALLTVTVANPVVVLNVQEVSGVSNGVIS